VFGEGVPLPRNKGAVVNVLERTIRERNGITYPLERFAVGDCGVYYGRPMDEPKVTYHERWLIPGLNLSFSRWDWRSGFDGHLDWYIEPDLVFVRGDEVHVIDGYIDLEVYEGVRYEVDDIDEFTHALASGELPMAEGLEVLASFHRISTELRQNGFLGAELLARWAPGLPG